MEIITSTIVMEGRFVKFGIIQGGGVMLLAPKEYLLVIERTAPPSVFQTCVSPNLSPCSVRQSGSLEGASNF